MTPAVLAVVAVAILVTAFISGIFGMAGGMILMGVLLTVLPVTSAMVMHGVIQATSNGWRALLWRTEIRWRLVLRYLLGLIVAGALFTIVRFVPSEAVALIGLGITPFIALAVPQRFVLQAEHRFASEICGFLCTASQFITGVSAAALDAFYVRSSLDRKAIIATKAACQVATHLAKVAHFGGMALVTPGDEVPAYAVFAAIALAMLGTSLSRILFHRLSDAQFRRWTKLLVLASGAVYLVQGVLALQR